MTIIHWLLWKLSRSAFNINTAFLPMCIFLMEKYSLSPGILAAAVPVMKKCSLEICQTYSFPFCSQIHHRPQYGLGSSRGFLCTQHLVSQSLSEFAIMCCHGPQCSGYRIKIYFYKKEKYVGMYKQFTHYHSIPKKLETKARIIMKLL